MTTENMNFGADVSRLLEIVTHALYTNRDVFLRELVSNSADACDKLRYAAITNPEICKGHKNYRIHITVDTTARTLTVCDSGAGMTRDDLIENLGTIAKSGTKALMEQLKQSGDGGAPNLIGQFGVGFYAAFMVASHVDVISRAAGSNETFVWSSNGIDGFTVRGATVDECAKIIDVCGTTVILTIKDSACDFLLEEKIKQVVTTYSNHINLPVFVGADLTTPINSASALWMRPRSEVSEDQYNEFFAICSGSMGIDKPAVISHWRAEGKIEYSALLFIPTLRPWDLHDPTRKSSVRLYVRRVFITDNCDGLVYPWLRFMRGVIDSEDLPLNISRETLQHNPIIAKIRTGVTKHILADLDKLSKADPIAFGAFWHQFGAVVKEGLYDAHDHRADIFKIARFYSTASINDMTNLDDYVARMKDGQDAIYYLSGENVENMRNSPQIEGLKKRGLEVLLLKDTIDDFWLPVVMDYQGKKFMSATKGAIDLSKFPLPENDADKTEKPTPNACNKLIDYMKEHLSEFIGDVRISDRLTDSPVCLVAPENDVDLNMGRVLKIHQKYETKTKPVLEINPNHPLIIKLDNMAATGLNVDELNNAADLLYDQACIIQGEPVKDPSAFARRMAEFVRRGLVA